MSKLIMLIGVPGSGKSTWAQQFLKDNQNYVYVSTDAILEKWAVENDLTYQESFNLYYKKAEAEVKAIVLEAVKNKLPVLWDQTNLIEKARVLKVSPFIGYHKTAKVFHVSRETMKERLAKRELETGKHIPLVAQNKMWNDYKELDLRELERDFDEVQVHES